MGLGRCLPLVLFLALVLVPSGVRLHAEEEPTSDGAVLRGVVLDAKGAAVKGAVVRAWTHHYGSHVWSRARIERCFDPQAKSRIIGSTRTDAAGRWHLGGLVHRGLYGVAAAGKDQTRSPTHWTFAFRGTPPPSELRLAPTVALDGRLVDAKGNGLAGMVTVAANPPRQSHGAWAASGGVDAPDLKTDADGRFTVHAPADYRLFVRAEVHGLGAVSLTPSNKRVAATPEKMKRLEGRIAKLPGKIRGSKITARRGPVTFPGTIAEDGNFSFEGLPPGSWQLEIKLGRPYKGTFKPKKSVRAGDLFAVVAWE